MRSIQIFSIIFAVAAISIGTQSIAQESGRPGSRGGAPSGPDRGASSMSQAWEVDFVTSRYDTKEWSGVETLKIDHGFDMCNFSVQILARNTNRHRYRIESRSKRHIGINLYAEGNNNMFDQHRGHIRVKVTANTVLPSTRAYNRDLMPPPFPAPLNPFPRLFSPLMATSSRAMVCNQQEIGGERCGCEDWVREMVCRNEHNEIVHRYPHRDCGSGRGR